MTSNTSNKNINIRLAQQTITNNNLCISNKSISKKIEIDVHMYHFDIFKMRSQSTLETYWRGQHFDRRSNFDRS